MRRGLSPGSLWRLPPQHRGGPRGRVGRWRVPRRRLPWWRVSSRRRIPSWWRVPSRRRVSSSLKDSRLCRLMSRCERRFKPLANPYPKRAKLATAERHSAEGSSVPHVPISEEDGDSRPGDKSDDHASLCSCPKRRGNENRPSHSRLTASPWRSWRSPANDRFCEGFRMPALHRPLLSAETGPAFENLQGRKPRVGRASPAPQPMGI